MIDFLPYQSSHALELADHSVEKGIAVGARDSAVSHEFFPATTAVLDGHVIACFGVHELWGGVGDVWAIIHEDILKLCPREFVTGARNTLDMLMQRYHRLQCVIDPRSFQSANFVEHYGFAKEGTLRKYSHDGRDFYLYARVRDVQ